MAVELSQKCQYALRAVFELTKRYEQGPEKIYTIAEAQAIPSRFLENILNELKRDGIVDSRRGKSGGYVLTRDPSRLSVGTIIELMQGPINVVECDGGDPGNKCPFDKNCVFWPVWQRANEALKNVYYAASLADLAKEEESRLTKEAQMYTI